MTRNHLILTFVFALLPLLSHSLVSVDLPPFLPPLSFVEGDNMSKKGFEFCP